jgi:sugar/nucleoside kinase (ribokinase family)
MIEVSVIGELNLDLILYGLPADFANDREYLASGMKLTLGSSSAIFAHNLSILGTKVGFIAKTGDDRLGKMAEERLEESGVELSRLVRGSGGTPTGLTVVLPHGQHRYILTYPGTMSELEYEDIDFDYASNAQHLHVSSFFLHKALRPRMVELFGRAKDRGLTTSLDTNDDPEGRWGADVVEVLKQVDIFLPNEREAKKIAGTENLSEALQKLSNWVPTVVVKRGSAPAICRSGSSQIELSPPRVLEVDDIGAGDTFDAAFIHLWLRKAPLEHCLEFANIAAAYSVTREGGTEAFRDRHGLGWFVNEHWDDSLGPAPLEANVVRSRFAKK